MDCSLSPYATVYLFFVSFFKISITIFQVHFFHYHSFSEISPYVNINRDVVAKRERNEKNIINQETVAGNYFLPNTKSSHLKEYIIIWKEGHTFSPLPIHTFAIHFSNCGWTFLWNDLTGNKWMAHWIQHLFISVCSFQSGKTRCC